MPKTTHALLDELEIIDSELLEGTATETQETRGQQIVNLANAAPKLIAALRYALPYMEDLANSGSNAGERRAVRRIRDAIAAAEEK